MPQALVFLLRESKLVLPSTNRRSCRRIGHCQHCPFTENLGGGDGCPQLKAQTTRWATVAETGTLSPIVRRPIEQSSALDTSACKLGCLSFASGAVKRNMLRLRQNYDRYASSAKTGAAARCWVCRHPLAAQRSRSRSLEAKSRAASSSERGRTIVRLLKRQSEIRRLRRRLASQQNGSQAVSAVHDVHYMNVKICTFRGLDNSQAEEAHQTMVQIVAFVGLPYRFLQTRRQERCSPNLRSLICQGVNQV
jgi:hypothetical protein